MTTLRVIGDIHGDYGWYVKTVGKANYKGISTFQLGDFGIGFAGKGQVKKDEKWMIDSLGFGERNRFGPGNHDNPDHCRRSPLSVGYHNYFPDMDMFWAGGAWSIDQAQRTEHVDWWSEEEMSYGEMMKCLDLYERSKPRIVISHDGPWEVLCYMFPYVMMSGGDGSNTSRLLQSMFEIHQPEIWLFGHHHQNIVHDVSGTNFRCIGINSYFDVEIPDWDGVWK